MCVIFLGASCSNGKKRNTSNAQNKFCQLDRAVVPVSNANNNSAETVVNQEKIRAQQVNQRTDGNTKDCASFHSDSKQKRPIAKELMTGLGCKMARLSLEKRIGLLCLSPVLIILSDFFLK